MIPRALVKAQIGVVFLLAGASLALGQGIAGHPEDYSPTDIALGARLYDAQCTPCHGQSGDGVGGVNFRRGVFPSAVTDRDLARVITGGVPGKGMPAFRLDPPEVAGVIAYLRNFNPVERTSLKPGDPARGRLLFETKGECAQCHRVGATGPRLAPDLSDVGTARTAASILRALSDPSSEMRPIDRPVFIVMRDGRRVTGRRLNEDTYTVQLIDAHERLVSLPKKDIRQYVVSTVSPMPSYKGRFSDGELADLLAYLLSLKGR